MDFPESLTEGMQAGPYAHLDRHTHNDHDADHGRGTHPASRPSQPLMRKAQVLLLGGMAAVVAVAVVLGPQASRLASGGQPDGQAGEAARTQNTRPFTPTPRQWAGLRVVRVQDRVFEKVHDADGKIAFDDDLVAPVFSPYSGRVVTLFARAGDQVTVGTPLFSIQGSEQAQAQNDLVTAASNLKTARAQLTLAQTNDQRRHELYLAQGGSLTDWQQSHADLATAQGNLSNAVIALAAVRNRLRILGASDQDIEAVETTSNPLLLDAETIVRAPIGGTVVQRQIGLGQTIASASAGATSPVFMIGGLSKVWLVANASEEDAPSLHQGDAIEVRALALPGKVFKARLTYVAASIDPDTHRLPVRAEVENPNGELKPDMLARFRIITGQDTAAPAVPESAIVYEGDAAHVWLANLAAKTLAIRPVVLGRSSDGMVEALNGLKPGDAVVTAGAVLIRRAATGN